MHKELVCTVTGAIGAAIATTFGGWDAAIKTLLIFMAVDYLSGLAVAGVFKNSAKTDNGALKSSVGWKGLCKKGMTLGIVLVSNRLDIAMETTYIRDATVIAFVVNETISIIENAGLMGVPIPETLIKAIDVLKSKNKGSEE